MLLIKRAAIFKEHLSMAASVSEHLWTRILDQTLLSYVRLMLGCEPLQENVHDESILKKSSFSLFSLSLQQLMGAEP